MQNIKFRAKNAYTGDWEYGVPVGGYMINSESVPNKITDEHECSIAIRTNNSYWTFEDSEIVEIDTDTIGQSTGLYDKDGSEIFIGDTLKIVWGNNENIGEVWQYPVSFKDECLGVETNVTFYPLNEISGSLKIIGNIYEIYDHCEEYKHYTEENPVSLGLIDHPDGDDDIIWFPFCEVYGSPINFDIITKCKENSSREENFDFSIGAK